VSTTRRGADASPADQARYWNRTLNQLVAQGLLTRADRKTLSRLPFDATVLEHRDPTTDFGKQIKSQSEEQPEAQANTGAGFVIGAIIGGAMASVWQEDRRESPLARPAETPWAIWPRRRST
jgi:hypothetical protein